LPLRRVFSVAFAAAKANIYVQQWQKEFPELWSDEQLARNVPLRVEFEQVCAYTGLDPVTFWQHVRRGIPIPELQGQLFPVENKRTA